jgi:hypothetical protein
VLNRRPSDAVLLVLAVAAVALVLTATLALHSLMVGSGDAIGSLGRIAVSAFDAPTAF